MKSLTVLVAASMFSLLAGPVIADPWKNESGHYHDRKGPPAHARGYHKKHEHRRPSWVHHHGKPHREHHDHYHKPHYPDRAYHDPDWVIGINILVPLIVDDSSHHRSYHREYRYR